MHKYSARLVGLSFDEAKGQAPEVSLKAEGELAARVVRWARRCGVPIVEEPKLVEALSGLEVEEVIPRDLFRPAALILASLKRWTRGLPPKNNNK